MNQTSTGRIRELTAKLNEWRHEYYNLNAPTVSDARNMASGSIRCYDASSCAGRGLMFSPFGVLEGFGEDTHKSMKLMTLKSLGFSVCEFLMLIPNSSERQVSNNISELQSRAEELGLPIDGIVITYDDIAYSLSCGRTDHHYKDGIAFKFEDGLHETTLRDIEWQRLRFKSLLIPPTKKAKPGQKNETKAASGNLA